MSDERITSMYVTDKETGERFELDFCRESVVFAGEREFTIDNFRNYPAKYAPALFFYAFRMHHKNVSREKTDALLEGNDGLPDEGWTRLLQLFQQAEAHNIIQSEESRKNPKLTLEL